MKYRGSTLLLAGSGIGVLAICAAAHQGCVRDALKAAVLRTAGPALYNRLRVDARPTGSVIGMRTLPPEGSSATKIIDPYGQYVGIDWPNKIHSDADFVAHVDAEQKDLAAHPSPHDWDKYGGWAKGTELKATGYFRTEQKDGKWWLVTPNGHLYFSIGMVAVSDTSPTIVSGREQLFSQLPDSADVLSKHYGKGRAFTMAVRTEGTTFDFYGANLERKYGPDYKKKWRDVIVDRLHSWGFNTLGNWSGLALERTDRVPYTADMNIVGDFHTVNGGANHWGRMPDPFDPEFEKAAQTRLRLATKNVDNDPWCIGYFIDNELSWRGYDKNGQYALAMGTLQDDVSISPAKQAFLAQLKTKYTTIDDLNSAWDASYQSWDDLNSAVHIDDVATKAQATDFSSFVEAYAEQYFKVVSTTLKALDPNHLYLGCRIAVLPQERPVREVFEAAAKYCDVISFNYYNHDLPASQWDFLQDLSKPLIIGEFHFGSTDRGVFWGGMVDSGSQAGRAKDYARFVRSAATNPSIVGCHWFEYLDQPVTGRVWDGENGGIGFVDITDTPYPELVQAARSVNYQIYADRVR